VICQCGHAESFHGDRIKRERKIRHSDIWVTTGWTICHHKKSSGTDACFCQQFIPKKPSLMETIKDFIQVIIARALDSMKGRSE